MSECVYMCPHPCKHMLLNCVQLSSTVYLGGGCLIVCFCGRLATVQGNNPASFEIVFAIIVRVSSRNLSENIAF